MDHVAFALVVVARDHLRAYAVKRLMHPRRRGLRQRHVHDLSQVHLGLLTRTSAFAPGTITPESSTNSACTSMVPLAGSTTGLTVRTFAECDSFGLNGDTTMTVWLFAIFPRKYSGSVNCTFTGLVAVTQNSRSFAPTF